jgi:hypothetical protein
MRKADNLYVVEVEMCRIGGEMPDSYTVVCGGVAAVVVEGVGVPTHSV